VALRRARLIHQPARPPFTQAFVLSVLNGNAMPLGT
jgi:hypothetical protein